MSSTTDDGDRALLSRAAAGDRRSFGALYDRHVRAVYWQAYAVLNRASEAEEVTQDVFVTLWRRIDEIISTNGTITPTPARWVLIPWRSELD